MTKQKQHPPRSSSYFVVFFVKLEFRCPRPCSYLFWSVNYYAYHNTKNMALLRTVVCGDTLTPITTSVNFAPGIRSRAVATIIIGTPRSRGRKHLDQPHTSFGSPSTVATASFPGNLQCVCMWGLVQQFNVSGTWHMICRDENNTTLILFVEFHGRDWYIIK